MAFEIVNDLFVLLRDFFGTICVVGIVIFIILWFFGMKRIKYYSFRNQNDQKSKKDKNDLNREQLKDLKNTNGKIIDIEAEEKDTFERFDKET
ncbi:MAG TPA: hypothetical protein VI912_05860 [Candidatus Bilamarchaeaceae archaeon]|nr:hypothetical protein [Candidatus Bilamarchaeaceae archaeon]